MHYLELFNEANFLPLACQGLVRTHNACPSCTCPACLPAVLSQRCYPAKSALFHFVVNKLREMDVDVTNPPQPVVVQGGFLPQGMHMM